MSDSLDDFFAKKDKSKKKSKSKSSKNKIVAADLLPCTPPNEGTEDLVQPVSELTVSDDVNEAVAAKEKRKIKKKKDKEGTEDQRRKEDEEWVTIEEEKDYSGLRIATKSLASAPDEGNEDGPDSGAEYDEFGQPVPRFSEPVWKTAQQSVADDNDEEEDDDVASKSAPHSESVPVDLPNVSAGGKYIPPSLRGRASGSSSTSATSRGDLEPVSLKRVPRKKAAPNITSQEDFPTLGSAPPPPDTNTANFERVRGGASGLSSQSRAAPPPQVETRNMFSALR